MRNLILFLFLFLLGINGLLLWQAREDKNREEKTCCTISGKVDIRVDDVKSLLMPGILGLVQ